ncbi:retrovirus-related Pol polyprotein from transposon 412 [Trichonephila clavipes]|nr:retrovirus-related Pol polyprotein from transposon 412 [Trichonephila clavipes]
MLDLRSRRASCRARQGAETNKRLPEGGVGKLINDHIVGRRLPDFGKPHIPVCQISTKSTGAWFIKNFNKNELRSIVTIFKIEHRTESIRQVTANENITIPPRTEIIVPGYIGNDKEVNYLGHIISAEGVRTDPEKSVRRKELKRPENLRELRSFLGLCTYYRKFVKGFSNIARPLHKLTEKVNKSFSGQKNVKIPSSSLKKP